MLILTNRRILLAQTDQALTHYGVDHGVFASGYEPEPDEGVQLGSIQTVIARADDTGLPDCALVLVDESHSNARGRARTIIEHHKSRGAQIVGLTATPIGLAGLYDAIVSMSSNSELIKAGVLVPGTVFSPPEISMKGVRIVRGEFVASEVSRRVREMIVFIFGDVLAHFRRLNPDMRPSALFASGVSESRFFVERFNESGIAAAHIDGTTPAAERADIFAGLESGKIKLVSSCGCLREGWNCPIVECGLLVQPCAGLSTYLQVVGRLKRAAEGKSRYLLIDHSGCWHRFGNPDADRTWSLDDDDATLARRHKDECEAGAPQSIRCPECGAIRERGLECPQCHHRHTASVRVVRQTDGTLVRMVGGAIRQMPEPSLLHQLHCLTGSAKDGREWI